MTVFTQTMYIYFTNKNIDVMMLTLRGSSKNILIPKKKENTNLDKFIIIKLINQFISDPMTSRFQLMWGTNK